MKNKKDIQKILKFANLKKEEIENNLYSNSKSKTLKNIEKLVALKMLIKNFK